MFFWGHSVESFAYIVVLLYTTTFVSFVAGSENTSISKDAVQGHPRSLILVRIKSSYMWLLISLS